MIYHFTGKCQESVHLRLEVDSDADHTFYSLHYALQSCLGFQPEHLACFLVPAAPGLRQIEITMFNPVTNRSQLYTMVNTRIGDIVKQGRNVILYVFDMLNDRYITLKLTGTIMENNLREPKVMLKKGEIPVQAMDDIITGDVFEAKEIRKADPDYGILNDYYEIFGEMEEYVI